MGAAIALILAIVAEEMARRRRLRQPPRKHVLLPGYAIVIVLAAGALLLLSGGSANGDGFGIAVLLVSAGAFVAMVGWTLGVAIGIVQSPLPPQRP
jgi:hypothetical protein